MSEQLRLNPEQEKADIRLADFFGAAEIKWPTAAGKFVEVVGKLVGEKPKERSKLHEDMKNIDVGLALIGDWLKEVGAEGFDVNLGFGGGAKKALGRSQIKFPTISDLIRQDGKVDQDLKTQMPQLLNLFSRRVNAGLKSGLPPRAIMGGLVRESIGSQLSVNGSGSLREVLSKPVSGHFEYLREELGAPDVAGRAGFAPRLQLSTFEQPRPVAAKRGEKTVVTASKERKEIVLTKEEAEFIKLLEVLENYEQGNRRRGEDTPLNVLNQLGQAFSKLAPDSPIRKEVMVSVVKQLGSDGEKLTQENKDEKDIFYMWSWRMNALFDKQQKPY